MDPLIGQTINQKFLIHSLLGEGGMGKVYAGEQLGIGRKVAIKVLHENLSNIPSVATRFEREAAAAGRVTHPNSVTIFDFGRDPQGRLYLAMEYLDGESLSARLKRERRLSVSIAVNFVSQLLETLDACHASGVVHRDLKPDNIFICPQQNQEVIKVLDYGIARLADAPEVTKTGQLIGTPYYMSPEQATGKKITAATDIYAVGVIFFELLTGRPPYIDKSNLDLFRKHLLAPIPTLEEKAPDRRELVHFEAIIQQALAKNPTERFSSARELRSFIQKAALDLRAGKYSALWTAPGPQNSQAKTAITPTQANPPDDLSRRETQAILDENGDEVATVADRSPSILELSQTMAGEANRLHLEDTQNSDEPDVEATVAMEKIELPVALDDLAHANTAIAPTPTPSAKPSPRVVLDPAKIRRTPNPMTPDAAKISAMMPKPVVPLDEALMPRLKLDTRSQPKLPEPTAEESLPFFTTPQQPALVLPDHAATSASPPAPRWPVFAAIPLLIAAVAVVLWPSAKPSGILVQTNPPGAKIFLNGVERSGTTPLKLELPTGKLTLEAQRTGCTTLKQELNLTPNTSQIILALICQ